MKYTASRAGRGCLRLFKSSTTAKEGQNHGSRFALLSLSVSWHHGPALVRVVYELQHEKPMNDEHYKVGSTEYIHEIPSSVMSAILHEHEITLTVTSSIISTCTHMVQRFSLCFASNRFFLVPPSDCPTAYSTTRHAAIPNLKLGTEYTHPSGLQNSHLSCESESQGNTKVQKRRCSTVITIPTDDGMLTCMT